MLKASGLDDVEEKLLGNLSPHSAPLVYKAVISMLRPTANDSITMVTQQVQAVLNALFFEYGKTHPPSAAVSFAYPNSRPLSSILLDVAVCSSCVRDAGSSLPRQDCNNIMEVVLPPMFKRVGDSAGASREECIASIVSLAKYEPIKKTSAVTLFALRKLAANANWKEAQGIPALFGSSALCVFPSVSHALS